MSMPTRCHAMPFGTDITPQGVRFRLWAPGCSSVRLCVENGMHCLLLPMNRQPGGWFDLLVPDAHPGTLYRFEVMEGLRVPDPASRANLDDVHGASVVVDPTAFCWQDDAWRGRRWEEAVIYELHVGTFSIEGTFAGAMKHLDHLVDLGVTAIELMPVADFPGGRNWGYDGVLLYAPDSRYGSPDELKTLIQAAHARGLMVFLDVVYNHFGPEGNYLHVYARSFFTERHHTPWGAAINFDGPDSATVREFFIHNALYWLEEFHLDGLRLDAVHAIIDESGTHVLTELAERVHAAMGPERMVHLILENDSNEAHHLGRGRYAAQWNDDIHHALHVLCTGEKDGYYADYAESPNRHLGRCLAEGFAYQGEPSPFRDMALRGEPSSQLSPLCFVSFLQCHDQVGNRAFGERISRIARGQAVRAAAAITLLAPSIPMLFMGEEFAAETPFLFFCDFGEELRDAVTQGRRREFGKFARFADAASLASIPDPNLVETFHASRLNWEALKDKVSAEWLAYYRHLLQLRRDAIVPRLRGMVGQAAQYEAMGAGGLRVQWRMADGTILHLLANLSNEPLDAGRSAGRVLFETPGIEGHRPDVLPPWTVVWTLEDQGRAA